MEQSFWGRLLKAFLVPKFPDMKCESFLYNNMEHSLREKKEHTHAHFFFSFFFFLPAFLGLLFSRCCIKLDFVSIIIKMWSVSVTKHTFQGS